MSARERIDIPEASVDPLLDFIDARPASVGQGLPAKEPMAAPAVGQLVGMTGAAPWVVVGACGTQAMAARSTVELDRSHIGMHVVLLFEGNDMSLPIVVGVMRGAHGWSAPSCNDGVEVDVDGQRMLISAQKELVLRCGAASIVLNHEGKIVIRGSELVSHSGGVNRIRGGSVQLN